MADCKTTGDIQEKLRRLFSVAIEQMLEIEMDGYKDILGCWISETEGASFWAGIRSDQRKRGTV